MEDISACISSPHVKECLKHSSGLIADGPDRCIAGSHPLIRQRLPKNVSDQDMQGLALQGKRQTGTGVRRGAQRCFDTCSHPSGRLIKEEHIHDCIQMEGPSSITLQQDYHPPDHYSPQPLRLMSPEPPQRTTSSITLYPSLPLSPPCKYSKAWSKGFCCKATLAV